MRLLIALASVTLLAGCATTAPPDTFFGHARRAVTFATFDHWWFSTKVNWQIFHYWNATATPRDAELAKKQGGWWGDEVPVGDKD